MLIFNFNHFIYFKVKKLKLPNMEHGVNIDKNVKALSHGQLVQLINDAAKISPVIKEVSLINASIVKPLIFSFPPFKLYITSRKNRLNFIYLRK